MKFCAETFGTFFPCQNVEPKLWHPAKTFVMKLYFGAQMYRPQESYEVKIDGAFEDQSPIVGQTFAFGHFEQREFLQTSTVVFDE